MARTTLAPRKDDRDKGSSSYSNYLVYMYIIGLDQEA